MTNQQIIEKILSGEEFNVKGMYRQYFLVRTSQLKDKKAHLIYFGFGSCREWNHQEYLTSIEKITKNSIHCHHTCFHKTHKTILKISEITFP